MHISHWEHKATHVEDNGHQQMVMTPATLTCNYRPVSLRLSKILSRSLHTYSPAMSGYGNAFF